MVKNDKKSGGELSTVVINKKLLRNKIYTIRGQRVMLDADLAEIYGYTTKAFNRQVKNNIEKFDKDFMFQLTWEELDLVLRCKNCTLKINNASENDSLRSKNLTLKTTLGDNHVLRSQIVTLKNQRGQHTKYLPYAFTEQGIYMLMTVLRGELAVKQSKALIRMFKKMKDYILEGNMRLEYRENLQLAVKAMSYSGDIEKIKSEITRLDNENKKLNKQMSNVVKRSEISPILLDFNQFTEQREFVFMNGELMKASELYTDIYASAKKSIYIIDNYINIKTLRHLQNIKAGVEVIVFSDNIGEHLHKVDYMDFRRERSDVDIRFIRTGGLIHDRFIVIDYGTEDETIYHSGASEKDAGKKLMMISKFEDEIVKTVMKNVMERLMGNEELKLK